MVVVAVTVQNAAKDVAEVGVVAAAVTVQNAAKDVAKLAMPSAAKHAPASVKSATENATRIEASVAGNVQNAAKVADHAKTATAATAKIQKAKTTGLQTQRRVWMPVQKRKPRCAPRHAPSASPVKSVAKRPLWTAHAPKVVANAVHAVKVAVVNAPPVQKSMSMRKAICH